MLILALLACTASNDDSGLADDSGPSPVAGLTIASDFDVVVTNNTTLDLVQALSGETVTVHYGEHHSAPASVSEATAGDGATRYFVQVPAAPARTPDGELWITYGELTSNRLPYFVSAWVDTVEPEVLTPGEPATLTGVNFGSDPQLAGGLGGVIDSATDTQIVFRLSPNTGTNGQLSVAKPLPGGTLLGNEQSFLEPGVAPIVTSSCAAPEGERCVLKGGGFGFGLGSGTLEVGGVAVTDFDGASAWSPTEVRFLFPDTVAPGVHTAVLTTADGHAVSFEVTKLGWTRQEVGWLARFDDVGGTLLAEGTALAYADRLTVFHQGVSGNPNGSGGSNLFTAGVARVSLGDLNVPAGPPRPLVPLPWPSGPGFLGSGSRQGDASCGTPRLGVYGNYAVFAWADGETFFVDDPHVPGRQCAASERVVNVDMSNATNGYNILRIPVASGWAVPGGVVTAADRAFVLVVDWIGGTTHPYMAAISTPPVLAATGHVFDSRGTAYQASPSTFYLAGGEPGWDGRMWEIDVEQGVNQGAFPALTPTEIPSPIVTTDALADRLLAFTGTSDGELVALVVQDDASQQLHVWDPVADVWSPWVVAPMGEIADIAVHEGVPHVLLYQAGRSGLGVWWWDDSAGEWAPLGEELTGWWGQWTVCEGPYAEPGPTGGEGSCTLEEVPRDLKTWRERPADAGRARLQAVEDYGLIATFDAWVTDDVYAGDLGDDRQYVAVWRD